MPTATLVSYIPKKNRNLGLLSTRQAEADVSDREDKKPFIVPDYDRNKGGVDNLDKVIWTYRCWRMTARWPLVVFHNILDVSSVMEISVTSKVIQLSSGKFILHLQMHLQMDSVQQHPRTLLHRATSTGESVTFIIQAPPWGERARYPSTSVIFQNSLMSLSQTPGVNHLSESPPLAVFNNIVDR